MLSETTSPSESLSDAEATSAISSLLSPKEEPQPKPTQPEPSSPTETTQQALPAPESKETVSEGVESTAPETPEAQPAAIRTLKVKLPDGEQDLPETEVVNGYLRNADYTRKQQALAEEKRKLESEGVQEIRAVRDQYADRLRQAEEIVSAMHPETIDWDARATQVTPEQLSAEVVEWQKAQKALKQLRDERATITTQQERERMAGLDNYLRLESAKIVDAIPDFGDAEKAPKLRQTLQEFAIQSYGFTADDFQNPLAGDSRIVRLIHDAYQAKQSQVKAPEIRNKIENAVTTTGPGATRSTKKTGGEELVSKAIKTGTERDARNAISALLKPA